MLTGIPANLGGEFGKDLMDSLVDECAEKTAGVLAKTLRPELRRLMWISVLGVALGVGYVGFWK